MMFFPGLKLRMFTLDLKKSYKSLRKEGITGRWICFLILTLSLHDLCYSVVAKVTALLKQERGNFKLLTENLN